MKTKYLRVFRVVIAAVLLITMLSVSSLAASKSIEEQMAENSAAWWIANNAGDTATCERLHAANEALAKLAAGSGGSASYNAGNGSWDITHDDGSRTTSARGGSNGSSNYVSYSTTTTGGSISGTTNSTYTDSSIDAYKAVGGTDAGLKQSYNNAGSNMSTTGSYGDTVAVTSAANEVSVAKEVLGLTDAQAKQLQADLEFLKQIYESAQADYVQANASGNTAAADEALVRMTKAHEEAESSRAKYNYTADANGFEDGGYYHDTGRPVVTPAPTPPPYVPPTYSITASSGVGGSISPSGVVSVTGGSSRSFSITPSAGYEISRVLVDGKDVGCVSSYTFTSIAGSHTIRAEFTEETLAITASAGVGGSITPSGTAWVAYGGSKTYTIKADTGYEIASVVVDGVNKGAISSYTFSNVKEAHTISVTFAKLRMKIDAFAGPGGSISPSGTAMVDYGGSKTYSIVPAVGYEIASVVVDGVNKGAVGSYTFSNVTEAHNITATFRPTGKVDIGTTGITDTLGAFLNGGSIKSGYGIMVSVPVTESGVTDVNVTLTYNFGQGKKTVTLVKSGSYYVFPKNADSPTKARCIYIPVETADSTYVLSISVTAKNAAGETVYDSDTAAVVVKGSMYEDDFTGDS